MATADSTRPAPEPIPVEAVYFEKPEGAPSIFALVSALEGVCTALDRLEPNVGDADELEHIAQLSIAAKLLARQLNSRWYGGKPPSKRQLAVARQASEEWAKFREGAGAAQ